MVEFLTHSIAKVVKTVDRNQSTRFNSSYWENLLIITPLVDFLLLLLLVFLLFFSSFFVFFFLFFFSSPSSFILISFFFLGYPFTYACA